MTMLLEILAKQVEVCKYIADSYADGPHTEGYYGRRRKDLFDAIDAIASLVAFAQSRETTQGKTEAAATPPAAQGKTVRTT